MVNFSDIVFYLSGSSVTDPKNSFGGAIQSVKVINNKNLNLFPRTTIDEALTGINKYLCLYVKNTHATDTINNTVAHITFNTEAETDEVQIGKGSSGKNGTEQRVSNILTAPSNVAFSLADQYNNGLPLGVLKAGEFFPIWFWLNVQINYKPLPNRFGVTITFDPAAGSSSGGGGEGGGSGGGGDNTPPPTVTDYTVTSASDYSCSSDAKDTIHNVQGFNPVKHIAAGDLSYDSNGDCWVSEMGTLINVTKIAEGNHESDSLMTKYLSKTGESTPYYVHKFKNIMLISFDMYKPFDSGSDQYNTIKSALESAKNDNNIDWRICFHHENFYSAPSHHGNNTSFRNIWHPIFEANNVDLDISGHNHNYQRTYPLKYNSSNADSPTIHNTGDPNYTNPDGIMFLTVGTAGRDLYPIDSQPSHVAFKNASEFGFLVMNFTNNAKKITGKFYKNANVTIVDQWSITKT
jgi:hypothetical protein